MTKQKSIMNVQDVTEYLDVNRGTVYRLARGNKIPAFKVGSDWRFNRTSINNWISKKERKNKPYVKRSGKTHLKKIDISKKKLKRKAESGGSIGVNKLTINKDADIKEKLRKIVARVARANESDIKDDVNLRDGLGLDSLNAMEVLAVIETKFGIQIDEARVFDIVIFKDLFNIVKSYLYNKTK